MTLGRIAIVLTMACTVLPLVLFLQSGDLQTGMLLLAAPLPCLVVYGFKREWADWTVGDLRQRRRDHGEVDADLDRALRGPVAPVSLEDDGAFFVPGCPALDETVTAAFHSEPPERPVPPTSTPLR